MITMITTTYIYIYTPPILGIQLLSISWDVFLHSKSVKYEVQSMDAKSDKCNNPGNDFYRKIDRPQSICLL